MLQALRKCALSVSLMCCHMSISATKSFLSKHVPSNFACVTYLNAAHAKAVDTRLMTEPGFSIDQLMELAGLSVANSVFRYMEMENLNIENRSRIVVFCGPGNNGGDGLVAARHLKHFGLNPTVVLPKHGKSSLFVNLVQQMVDLDIPVSSVPPNQQEYETFTLAVDALFGFSFQGPTRPPFTDIIHMMSSSTIPVVSVDLPSGWDVDSGDIHGTNFAPQAVVSLTAPKLCMRNYEGVHFVGGRFVPPKIAEELGIILPDYGVSTDQVTVLSYGSRSTQAGIAATAETKEPVNVMFVTASSSEEARHIARELVRRKLVACVNLVPGIESHYEWEGTLEASQEVLVMIKTRKSLVDAVTAAVQELHSYDVPESLALEVTGGSASYIDWVRGSTNVSPATAAGSSVVRAVEVEEEDRSCANGDVSAQASYTAQDTLSGTPVGTTDAGSI